MKKSFTSGNEQQRELARSCCERTRREARGFTLIETIIYIALFSVLLTSGFVVAFELVQSTDSLNARKVTIEESHFVMKKINWLLSSAASVTILNSSTLSVFGYDGVTRTITLSGGDVVLGTVPLTTENVDVEALKFSALTGTPSGITTVITLSGITSTSTKYLKQ